MTIERQVEQLRAALITTTLRAAAAAEGISASALDDILLHDRSFTVADDGTVRHKDGFTAADWLRSQRSARPHWFGATDGRQEASKGGDAAAEPDNPWTAGHWNRTRQAQIIIQDEKKAEQMARAAGVDVYAMRPKK